MVDGLVHNRSPEKNVFAFWWWLLGRSGLEGNQTSYGL